MAEEGGGRGAAWNKRGARIWEVPGSQKSLVSLMLGERHNSLIREEKRKAVSEIKRLSLGFGC